MGARGDAGAGRGGIRGALREQLGGEGAGGRALAGPRRALEQVGVRRAAPGTQRGAEDGGGVGVMILEAEHGPILVARRDAARALDPPPRADSILGA
jgi:hypothetical protein